MLQVLSPAPRNGTLKIIAIFTVAALAAILFSSHTIATQAVVDSSSLYGP